MTSDYPQLRNMQADPLEEASVLSQLSHDASSPNDVGSRVSLREPSVLSGPLDVDDFFNGDNDYSNGAVEQLAGSKVFLLENLLSTGATAFGDDVDDNADEEDDDDDDKMTM